MAIGINNVAPPSQGGDPLARRVAALERLVAQFAARPALENSTLSQGQVNVDGGAVVVNGGDFVLQDTTGTVLFRIGAQLNGDRGISAYRADGTIAWQIAKIFGPGDTTQKFLQYDPSGRVIGGDAQLSPSGFDSPHIPHVWRPADGSDAKTTTSATFESLFEHRGIRGNPAVQLTFLVLCDDATTAGEVQVIDVASGSGLGGFFTPPWVGTIPAGTTDQTILTPPPLSVPGAANDPCLLQVQARRTAGAGTVYVAVASSIGGGL